MADAIGNTPLVGLRGASEATGCTILGKEEFIAVAWLPQAKIVRYSLFRVHGEAVHLANIVGDLKLNQLFTYSDQIHRAALLLLLLGLGSCNQGPVTACVTSLTTCQLQSLFPNRDRLPLWRLEGFAVTR